ncbi:putative aldehyde dehydrogenase [Platanthera guangdongensis]|uniref:Aldehyde dehydrogenase n=1 Tax=Platanthera guangdongensis TaxID=2320717 RepID=A0ABR2ML58_9ASPA
MLQLRGSKSCKLQEQVQLPVKLQPAAATVNQRSSQLICRRRGKANTSLTTTAFCRNFQCNWMLNLPAAQILSMAFPHYSSISWLETVALSSLEVLGRTVNGTTYAGIRARTTGAPQNHWFGPAGDPRGAGIGTPEAIKLVWSCHREVIYDIGPVPLHWKIPLST